MPAEVYFEAEGVELLHGDCLAVLPRLEPNSVDAVVTDPPYELGFMGKQWDGTGIAYSAELWCQVLRVLKPGGHLLAFGGTRTYHRMTCAIEDAGFEIRDSLHWLYGTGFPKSLNIGDGRGTALKPGHEPIVMARKPLVGTVAQNILAHGTGALNVDACRIAGAYSAPSSIRAERHYDPTTARDRPTIIPGPKASALGRWPANVLLDEDAAGELDAQSGERPSGSGNKNTGNRANGTTIGHGLGKGNGQGIGGDSGGASRFFYVAKPSRAERDIGNSDNNHPTVKPVELMQYLVKLVTPLGGVVLDPFMGSGSTAFAAWKEFRNFIGIERDEHYIRIAAKRAKARAAQGHLFDHQALADAG